MQKIYMAFILLAAAVLFTSLRADDPVEGCGGDESRKSAGPPSCYAGEPPNNTTCGNAGCHTDFAINSGTALLKLDLGAANNGYMPGQSYTVVVSLSKAGLIRGGFQLVALQDNDISTTPGSIEATDQLRTQIINAAHPHSGGGCANDNKTWIEHTSDGIDDVSADSLRWQFTWNAPASVVGNITFYVTSVDANLDLDNSGDYVYSLTKNIASLISGINETGADKEVTVFPNPAGSFIQLKTAKPQTISISNTLGAIIATHYISSNATIDVSQFNSGIYYIVNQQNRLLQKFVKE